MDFAILLAVVAAASATGSFAASYIVVRLINR